MTTTFSPLLVIKILALVGLSSELPNSAHLSAIQSTALQNEHEINTNENAPVLQERKRRRRREYTLEHFVAGKKFLITNELLQDVEAIESVCQLNHEQRTKLLVATKRHSSTIAKRWIEENQDRFSDIVSSGDGNDKKEKVIVYHNADEIDERISFATQTVSRQRALAENAIRYRFWDETIVSLLSETQRQAFQKLRAEQLKRIQQFHVTQALTFLDSQMSLSKQQKEQIKTRLQPELRHIQHYPARIFVSANIGVYGLLRMEKDLAKILSPLQKQRWNFVKKAFSDVGPTVEKEIKQLDAKYKK